MPGSANSPGSTKSRWKRPSRPWPTSSGRNSYRETPSGLPVWVHESTPSPGPQGVQPDDPGTFDHPGQNCTAHVMERGHQEGHAEPINQNIRIVERQSGPLNHAVTPLTLYVCTSRAILDGRGIVCQGRIWGRST